MIWLNRPTMVTQVMSNIHEYLEPFNICYLKLCCNILDTPSANEGTFPDGIVSSDGMCAGLKAIDIVSAESSFMEYDTIASDDRKNDCGIYWATSFYNNINFYAADAQVPNRVDQLQCGGVIDAARATAGAVGESVKKTMKQVTLDVLRRLVVDEERIIDKGTIKIYAKM